MGKIARDPPGNAEAGFAFPGSRMQSNFPRLAGRPVDYDAVKARAYHDQGIAIIDLTDSRIPWQDREIIEGACRRLYGKTAKTGC